MLARGGGRATWILKRQRPFASHGRRLFIFHASGAAREDLRPGFLLFKTCNWRLGAPQTSSAGYTAGQVQTGSWSLLSLAETRYWNGQSWIIGACRQGPAESCADGASRPSQCHVSRCHVEDRVEKTRNTKELG
jgi:hypothetical protein